MGAMEPGPAKRTRASMKLNHGLSGLSIGKTVSSKRQKLEDAALRPASREDPYGAEVLATMQGRELAHARPTLLDKSSADQRADVLRKLPS